jgi:putative aminopeptidase
MDNNTRDRFRDDLARLTRIDGVSGHEHAVVAALKELCAPLVDRVEIDGMGNLYAIRAGGDGPHVMVEAHSDEIGMLVSAIEPAGWVRVQAVGGVSAALLGGRTVRVREHRGVIGVRPGHLAGIGNSPPAPDFESLYIDLGFDSREAVEQLGIRIGDSVVPEGELLPMANGERVVGKAIDNRAGCVVLVELLRRLHGHPLSGPLTVVIAVQEEVGMKGAGVAAERVRPDFALVIDTVPCADTPESGAVTTFPVKLGHGPVLQVSSDRSGSGYLMPEPIRDFLVTVCAEAGIPYQLATFAFGNTDASSIYVSAGGIPTAVATIARRYSHSPVEVLDLNDALWTVRLCEQVVQRAATFPQTWKLPS